MAWPSRYVRQPGILMARNTLTPLTPLPLNSGLAISFTHTAAQGALTGLPLKLVIDVTPATGGDVVRAEIDETDATLSNTDLTATLAKNSAWVGANLVAGRARALFFVDGVYDSGAEFHLYQPAGGDIDL